MVERLVVERDRTANDLGVVRFENPELRGPVFGLRRRCPGPLGGDARGVDRRVRHDERPLHDVLQLADVSGPGAAAQDVESLLGEMLLGLLAAIELAEEVLR
jgi:hypothetical protein